MNKSLLHPDIQDFIRNSRKADITRIVLSGSPFPEVSPQELAAQTSGLKTAEKKLPLWFRTKNILYPPKLNLEQTSSQVTAQYKASLVEGNELIDITGGFGIDTFFFSKKMAEVTYCEFNEELAEVAAYNFKILGGDNIKMNVGDGLDFLENTEESFDWIYVDPARRNNAGGKVFRLADCTPDVPQNLDLLFGKAKNLMIKTSPLLDIKAGLEELRNVTEIHVVAVNNDVKELLWVLKKDQAKSEISIKTVNFRNDEVQKFEGNFAEKASAELSLPKKFLYEPNPAIMKSGLFDLVGRKTGSFKLHNNSHLFTSEELMEFPGRVFEITDIQLFNVRQLNKNLNIQKANITTRNFPDSVEKLRKKLKIKEGGNTYLFFTTNLNNEKIVLICRKI